MVLDFSAIDAIVGALAAAFFGSIGALAVILLRQVLSFQRDLQALTDRLDKFKFLEDAIGLYGTQGFRSESRGIPGGRDGH